MTLIVRYVSVNTPKIPVSGHVQEISSKRFTPEIQRPCFWILDCRSGRGYSSHRRSVSVYPSVFREPSHSSKRDDVLSFQEPVERGKLHRVLTIYKHRHCKVPCLEGNSFSSLRCVRNILWGRRSLEPNTVTVDTPRHTTTVLTLTKGHEGRSGDEPSPNGRNRGRRSSR